MRTYRMMVAVALLLAVPSAFAQKKSKSEDAGTRSVQGAVTSADGNPVNGAVVQLKNTKTLQIRSFITKEDGTYYFHGLSPDIDYELKADHDAETSGPKTLSSFDSRKEAIVNLKLNKK
jgi:carboxypeptidase family protein